MGGSKKNSMTTNTSNPSQQAMGSLFDFMKNPSSDIFGVTNPAVSDGVQELQSTITQPGNGAQLPIMANSAISSQNASKKMQSEAPSLSQMFASYNPTSLRPINGQAGQAQKGGKAVHRQDGQAQKGGK